MKDPSKSCYHLSSSVLNSEHKHLSWARLKEAKSFRKMDVSSFLLLEAEGGVQLPSLIQSRMYADEHCPRSFAVLLMIPTSPQLVGIVDKLMSSLTMLSNQSLRYIYIPPFPPPPHLLFPLLFDRNCCNWISLLVQSKSDE
jgi:hypothetical protein